MKTDTVYPKNKKRERGEKKKTATRYPKRNEHRHSIPETKSETANPKEKKTDTVPIPETKTNNRSTIPKNKIKEKQDTQKIK